ncbi:hypothetical protein C7974DRAFT_412187 [Boeremia exigua]|uniref:uncharacterized protein n=1 Tax=Boeremia exigua TaxID=749465 RepID=UPI001E8E6DAF|nr:uncharacterized protein C7974DRAFT_412187 [Boeremia exigua]KAH6633171.1 hypothetical protein C7974DRAFT_412187 [Boeremia exigua]
MGCASSRPSSKTSSHSSRSSPHGSHSTPHHSHSTPHTPRVAPQASRRYAGQDTYGTTYMPAPPRPTARAAQPTPRYDGPDMLSFDTHYGRAFSPVPLQPLPRAASRDLPPMPAAPAPTARSRSRTGRGAHDGEYQSSAGLGALPPRPRNFRNSAVSIPEIWYSEPRQAPTWEELRSVSPLGSSRFERPIEMAAVRGKSGAAQGRGVQRRGGTQHGRSAQRGVGTQKNAVKQGSNFRGGIGGWELY